MAYSPNVNAIEGDLAVIASSQTSLEYGDSPRLFQLNNEEPHVVAKIGTTGSVQPCVNVQYSPDSKLLTWNVGQVIYMLNLETDTMTSCAVGVVIQNSWTFTGDSSTILVPTGTSPFVVAVDVATATLKGAIGGTWAFTSNAQRLVTGPSGKIYGINQSSATSGGPFYVYEYNRSTNSFTSVVTSPRGIGTIGCSISGNFLLIAGGAASTGGAVNIYNLSNFSETPATFTDNNLRGYSGQGLIARYGTGKYAFLTNCPSPGRFFDIEIKSPIATSTLELALGSGVTPIGVFNGVGNIHAFDDFGFIALGIFASSTVYGANYPVMYIDMRGFTSGGSRNFNKLPGVNEKYNSLSVSSLFTLRKLAGHVKDAANAPIARKVVVINRRTMRVIASTVSSAVDGSFTIPIYNGEQCIVMSLGTGTETTKIYDYVAPVTL